MGSQPHSSNPSLDKINTSFVLVTTSYTPISKMVAIAATAATAATIIKFIGHISARQYDQLPCFLAEKATWWTAGNPALEGDSGGSQDALAHVNVLKASKIYTDYSFVIKNQVTEKNKSIIEGQVIGDGPQDLHYVNNITMAFTLDNHNKITLVHEYADRMEINWLLKYLKDHNIVSLRQTFPLKAFVLLIQLS